MEQTLFEQEKNPQRDCKLGFLYEAYIQKVSPKRHGVTREREHYTKTFPIHHKAQNKED